METQAHLVYQVNHAEIYLEPRPIAPPLPRAGPPGLKKIKVHIQLSRKVKTFHKIIGNENTRLPTSSIEQKT